MKNRHVSVSELTRVSFQIDTCRLLIRHIAVWGLLVRRVLVAPAHFLDESLRRFLRYMGRYCCAFRDELNLNLAAIPTWLTFWNGERYLLNHFGIVVDVADHLEAITVEVAHSRHTQSEHLLCQ